MSLEIEILEIVIRTLAVSGAATLLAALWALPIGVYVGLKNFPGQTLVRSFFSALIGVPTVSLGLILYMLLSRSGPLGFLHLLYTPTAIAIGQAILVTPLIISFAASAVKAVDPEIRDLAKTLGASDAQASLAVLKESLNGIILAIIASFNRAVAELGIALMLGGNIRGATRVLTTSIALETTRGELLLGLTLTLILLTIVFALNALVTALQRWR